MKKEQRDLKRLAAKYGLEVRDGTKHLKVYAPDGKLVLVAPRGSGSSGRGPANLEATIRRYFKEAK